MSGFDRITLSFNSSELLDWIIAVVLAILLLIQIWLVVKNQALTAQRKGVRLGLNSLLWLILVGYFLEISWVRKGDNQSLILADSSVPDAYVNRLQDSLKIAETARVSDFKTPVFRTQLADGTVDAVTLVGSDFTPDMLGQLSRQTLSWIPYAPEGQLQQLRWQGIIRQGELQTISGRIQLGEKQVIKARFGNQTLDSLELPVGPNTFRLEFPVFSQGRTAVELVLNQKPLDTIRFFARKPAPISYQFILDSPDFESKTLADWLGKKGYSVELLSTIAKDIRNQVNINRAKAPDVLITSPENAANPLVKKAITQGKPVLFMNVQEPELVAKAINQAVGTTWSVKKISNEATVSLGTGIQGLPYQFRDAGNQFRVKGYPVAVQKTTAKIGLSLVSETFPLKLGGDSLGYDRVWTSILSQLQPVFNDNIHLDAPVFPGIRSAIRFNNLSSRPVAVRIGKESVNLTYSAINGLSAEATYAFGRAGWQPFQDSLALYVSDQQAGYGNQLISRYLRARSVTGTKTGAQPAQPAKIPDWIWLLLILGSLTALWVEPKFSI
ncbi:hypothetical protein GCM10027299_02390 [Larkinella ripae]